MLPQTSWLKPSKFVDTFFHDFDYFFNDLTNKEAFPKHNIVKQSEAEIVVELALAGYTKDDLEVSIHHNILTVHGKALQDDRYYIHKGIAQREFIKRWTLPEHLQVKNVTYCDGILRIHCELIIPEEKQKKLLEIK